jgi:MoaA/NifB/PqqE/SkfB family radical SAM enzyme
MIEIKHLAIEVTRKCNIQCSHCLRGESQSKDISFEYIDSLLNQVSSIGHFCPTGGEPSLNVPAIKYFLDGCKKRNIQINTFYIATNGVNLTENFINICTELYNYCIIKKSSGVQISNDHYHIKQKMYNDTLLAKLPFYSKRNKDNENFENGKKLHKEGRALENYKNAEIISYATTLTTETFDTNPIYLNVNGNIINGCDWSYDNQNNHFICEVNYIEKYKNMLDVR